MLTWEELRQEIPFQWQKGREEFQLEREFSGSLREDLKDNNSSKSDPLDLYTLKMKNMRKMKSFW